MRENPSQIETNIISMLVKQTEISGSFRPAFADWELCHFRVFIVRINFVAYLFPTANFRVPQISTALLSYTMKHITRSFIALLPLFASAQVTINEFQANPSERIFPFRSQS